MKILVPVRQVVDYNAKVRVKPDGNDDDIANVSMSMLHYHEIAVMEAARLKEKGVATKVVAGSCGIAQRRETPRTAMAIDSKVILTINKDAEAPMFSLADYSLENDPFVAGPELAREL